MKVTLHVWRQNGPEAEGRMETYTVDGVNDDMSFLEVLDTLNEQLTLEGKEPVAFDHDCREGICGACGMVINGQAHGPLDSTTTCQLHMRHFKGETEFYLEPWRARAFPVVRDLVVDRTAFDRIIQSGGYISVNSGSAPEANLMPVEKDIADRAFDAATCIGCGACVAQCPNGAAQLFTAAKVSHLSLLPQGQPERWKRVESMVAQMEDEAFGSCTNFAECEAVCPKGISIDFIARLNADFLKAKVRNAQS